jgi:hypothetical protein
MMDESLDMRRPSIGNRQFAGRSSIGNRQSAIGNPLDELDLTSGAAAAPSSSSKRQPLIEVAPKTGLPDPPARSSEPLVDLPLRAAEDSSAVPGAGAASQGGLAAGLAVRAASLAADAILVILLAAVSVLAAAALSGRVVRPEGLWWTAVFAVYATFFSTVLPLLLFGKTVGMALTGLTARGPGREAPLTLGESVRRWLGTALALAGLGLPLLATLRSGDAPTLADRISGRPLAQEGIEPQAPAGSSA